MTVDAAYLYQASLQSALDHLLLCLETKAHLMWLPGAVTTTVQATCMMRRLVLPQFAPVGNGDSCTQQVI